MRPPRAFPGYTAHTVITIGTNRSLYIYRHRVTWQIYTTDDLATTHVLCSQISASQQLLSLFICQAACPLPALDRNIPPKRFDTQTHTHSKEQATERGRNNNSKKHLTPSTMSRLLPSSPRCSGDIFGFHQTPPPRPSIAPE